MAEQHALEVANRPPPPEASEATELIRLALRDDVSVEKLERLMAMKEREDAKHARQLYLDAVAAFQQACPEIPKKRAVRFDDRPGARVAYHYADLPTVTRTIDPILREHGLSYSWTTEGMEGGVLNVVCVVRHVAGHEERVPFPVPVATNAKMSAAQKNGAALTYGRRQSLIAALGISTADEDPDGADPEGADTITEKQAADLEAKIKEVGADRGRFLRFLGVEALDDLPASRLGYAIQQLERKRGSS